MALRRERPHQIFLVRLLRGILAPIAAQDLFRVAIATFFPQISLFMLFKIRKEKAQKFYRGT